MELLAYRQYKVLNAHRDSLTRLEALLESIVPEKREVAYRAKKLREKAEKQDPITTAETVQTLCGLLRECRLLGPNSQEVLQIHLEPLIEKLGLADAINREVDMPRDLARKSGWSRG